MLRRFKLFPSNLTATQNEAQEFKNIKMYSNQQEKFSV
jgi:hypothetical protein